MDIFSNMIERSIGYAMPFFLIKPTGFLYIPLIFVVQQAIQYIISKIRAFYEKKSFSMTICETNENNYSYNELYEHISYFIQTIEHDSKIRHLTSSCSIVDESETCKMGNKKFNKIKPVFNLNERQILTIDISNYHKECIGIIKLSSIDDNNNNDNKNNNYSRAKMRYLIESDSKNNLDIFLNIVEEKSLEYFKKNLLDGQVYYYNYDCINYNSAWNKYKINCVKTYDNIFLEKNIRKI